METVVIGIDGGDWDVIDPLIQDGHLPNIAELINTGVRSDLESVTPPVSPPAWNSIQTGTNPGKHGIFDFGKFNEKYERHPTNSSDRQTTPFWRVMNDHGVRTGLFKFPFTYPPDDVDGFFVTGFPTPNSVEDYGYPSEVVDEVGGIEQLFEDYSYRDKGEFDRFKENLVTVANQQHESLIDLLDDRNPEFLMTVYDGADRLQHFFWKYVDESHPRYESHPALKTAFQEYYKSVDKGIGELLDIAGPETNIIILSDHGFGKLSYDIYIDEWLEEAGFLSRESPDRPDHLFQRAVQKTIKQSWEVVKSLNLDDAVKSILPSDAVEKGRTHLRKSDRLRTIAWEDTTAFFTTLSGQAIHINLEDRFVAGTVSRGEYEEVIDSLQTALLDLKHPDTGKNLIKNVVRSDEVFEGEAVAEAPDLIIETDPEYTLKGGRSDSLITPSKQYEVDRSGDHRPEGILIANGPAFGEGSISNASVLDVAPSLLFLHSCPIPEIVDGEVLTEIFDRTFIQNHSIKYTDDYQETTSGSRKWSGSEEEEIEQRLNDMGYLG